MTASPIDPASASTPSHNLLESSIPTVHIPSGDSDDDIPLVRLKRKRKRQETTVPSSKRQTRASIKQVITSDVPLTPEKAIHKRKTIAFPTSLPQRQRRTSSAAAIETHPKFPTHYPKTPYPTKPRIPTFLTLEYRNEKRPGFCNIIPFRRRSYSTRTSY